MSPEMHIGTPRPILQTALVIVALAPCGLPAARGDQQCVAAGGANETAGLKDNYGDALPAGAVRRLGTTRLRQRSGLIGAVFSPDGKLLATCGWGDSIRVWDARSGRPVRRIHGSMRSETFGVAFSPDGKLLAAVGGQGLVRLFEVRTGRELMKSKSRVGGRVFGVAFSPDGKTFASAGGAGDVRLWDVATRKTTRVLWNRDPVRRIVVDNHAIAFSHDGRRLASARGTTVRTWDLKARGKETTIFVERQQPWKLITVAFSADDKTLYSYRERHGAGLEAWDVASGKSRTMPNHKGIQLGAGGNCAALSKDGSILATSTQNDIRIWDARTARVIRTFTDYQNKFGMRTFGLAISPDKRLLAARAGDNALRLWDLKTGKPVWREPDLHTSTVRSCVFSPDGKTLATADGAGRICIWDRGDGGLLHSLQLGRGAVRGLAYTPDGKTLIAGSTDYEKGEFFGRLITYEVAIERVLKQRQFNGRVTACAVSRDGKLLASADADFGGFPGQGGDVLVHIIDAKTWKDRKVLKGHKQFVRSMAFSANGKSLVCVDDGAKAIRWDLATGKPTRTVELRTKGKPRLFIFSYELHGQSVYVCGERAIMPPDSGNREVVQWDLQTGKSRSVASSPGGWVGAVAVSPDGKLLAAWEGKSGTGKDWFSASLVVREARSGKELLRRHIADGRAQVLAFSPDGKLLASGMWRGDTLLWDVSTLRPARR